MNHIETIHLKAIGGSPVLAGGAAGAAVQKAVLNELSLKHVELCALDFSGVECATASFIREAVFGTRDSLRRAGLITQIVVTNGNQAVREELLLVARAVGSSIVHATGASDHLTEPIVFGELDAAQRETLALVLQLGEATASDLAAENPAVKPTAWNNRLANLASRGLLSETRRERHKVYRAVVKGLSYGR